MHGRHGDFADAVADYPLLAVRILEECGRTFDDFMMAIRDEEMGDGPDYRPLMAS